MKKILKLLMSLGMVLALCACASNEKPAENPTTPASTAAAETTEQTQPAAAETTEQTQPVTAETVRETEPAETQPEVEVVGPWHLEGDRNDLSAFADIFPGYGEFGARMEIRSNGQMSWCIGAAGGYGTYTRDADTITAELTSDMDQKPMTMTFRLITEKEVPELEMEYNDTVVRWTYGDSGELSGKGE